MAFHVGYAQPRYAALRLHGHVAGKVIEEPAHKGRIRQMVDNSWQVFCFEQLTRMRVT